MDGYQFIASILQSIVSLAWPVIVLVIVLVFRTKLVNLLPLARLKYKDLELRFHEAAKEAAKLDLTPATAESEPTPEEVTKFEKMAKLAPRGAMLEVRANLEEAVREYAQVRGPWRPECGWNLSDVISRGLNLSDCHFAFKSSLGRESEPIGSPLVRFSGKAAVSVPPVFSIDAHHAARSIG